MTITEIFDAIEIELAHADKKYAHDPMTSPELGLATIKCELAELERELMRPVYKPEWMRKEAIQSASMMVKFLRDICN
jgi:hypothetical protein